MITRLDRTSCKQISTSAMNKLKQMAEELGLELREAGGKFTDLSFTMKLEFKVKESASGLSGEEEAFRRNALSVGLSPDYYGLPFRVSGTAYKLVAIDQKKFKYPVIAVHLLSGKKFKFPVAPVLQAIKDQHGK